MKYIIYVLTVLLVLSIGLLIYNGYNYYKYNNEDNIITNEITDLEKSISDMDSFINSNKELYDEKIKNNSEKASLYNKWKNLLEEVESSL